MNSTRSAKSYYAAAFILGALIALVASVPTARSAETFRLDRIGIARFTATPGGRLVLQQGILHLDGRVVGRGSVEIDRPANTPEWALDRNLIRVDAWQSYRGLGSGALDNFKLLDGAARFSIGDESFLHVAPDPEATTAGGRMINLSTRTRLSSAEDTVVAGFVIEGQPRIVLVRAVGPGLARFGLTTPVSDPALEVKRGGQTLHANDNWSVASEGALIREAAARVGAFPLDDGSRDAARLVRLEPGAYTLEAKASGTNVAGRDVLLEIYSVPDDAIDFSDALQ